MQTYTCPTCGENMERDLSLFMDHTDKHIVDEVRKQNPQWVTQEGYCPKCLEYFKSQMRPGSVEPGTNLDSGGVQRRYVLGVLGWGAAIGAYLWLGANEAPPVFWLILFPLIFFGMLGFLQGKRRLCVVIAQKQEETFRRKARNILIFSLVVAAILTTAALFLQKG